MRKQYIKPAGTVVELLAEQMVASSIGIYKGSENEVGAEESFTNKRGGFGSNCIWDNDTEEK